MLLALDAGNTNLTLGLYEDEKLGSRWRLATDHERMPDEYGLQIISLLQHAGFSPEQLDGICLSSVVPPLTGRLVKACKYYLQQEPFLVSHLTTTNIRLLVDEPASLGADRIADTVAVGHLYGGPACVIDFGTATTFNIVSQEGDYLGGAIAPGVGIASEALYQRTAKLPRVDLVAPPSILGKNTIHQMQAGLVYGYVSMVEGMVARYRQVQGDELKVIATGGLAELISAHTDCIQILAPWLTLDGLRIIWEMNHK